MHSTLMESKARNSSFSNVFLPNVQSMMKSLNVNCLQRKDVVAGPFYSEAQCSFRISDDSSSSSVSTEGDSGVASSAEETVTPKKRQQRRAPGCLNLEELFAKASANSSTSEDYHLKMVKEIRIEDGSVGFGYDRLFAEGLNEQLRVVCVEDPYISNESQVYNFIVFCEVLVSRAPNLKKVVLRTRSMGPDIRSFAFVDLKNSLLNKKIELVIQRSDTIHDREIRFDNGWTYRIGRGLDYFQKQQGFTLGMANYNFRKCLETSVCITKELR